MFLQVNSHIITAALKVLCLIIIFFFLNINSSSLNFALDIDQLTRIMVLCGKPDEEFLNKINSEEVRM